MTPEQEKMRREFVEGITKMLNERLHCEVMVLIHDPVQGLSIMENFINNYPMEFGLLDLARLMIAQRLQSEMIITPTVKATEDVKGGFEKHLGSLVMGKKKVN